MKPYFHLMSDKEWDKRRAAKFTWGDICKIYQRPEWCRYDGALEGMFGCASLVSRLVTGQEYCADCECHQANCKRDRREAKRREVK
jgi:hypothetical protein